MRRGRIANEGGGREGFKAGEDGGDIGEQRSPIIVPFGDPFMGHRDDP